MFVCCVTNGDLCVFLKLLYLFVCLCCATAMGLCLFECCETAVGVFVVLCMLCD
jgi:hypothetical protein